MQGIPNYDKRTTQKFDTKSESIIQQLGKVSFLLNDISENMFDTIVHQHGTNI